jgi:hypothetical protein
LKAELGNRAFVVRTLSKLGITSESLKSVWADRSMAASVGQVPMPTTRVPIRRTPRGAVTTEMLDAFAALRNHERSLPPDAIADETWWQLHARLADQIPDKQLWEWPVIVHPNDAGPNDEASVARWRVFDDALQHRSATSKVRK